MFYLFEASVKQLPPMKEEEFKALLAKERATALNLIKEGKIKALYYKSGQMAVVGIFDVASNEELHKIAASLPMFPVLDIKVTPLNEYEKFSLV